MCLYDDGYTPSQILKLWLIQLSHLSLPSNFIKQIFTHLNFLFNDYLSRERYAAEYTGDDISSEDLLLRIQRAFPDEISTLFENIFKAIAVHNATSISTKCICIEHLIKLSKYTDALEILMSLSSNIPLIGSDTTPTLDEIGRYRTLGNDVINTYLQALIDIVKRTNNENALTLLETALRRIAALPTNCSVNLGYSPQHMFEAAELLGTRLDAKVAKRLYVLSINPTLIYMETAEPFNRWITATQKLIELKISKENISRFVNVIERWLTLNDTYLNSSDHQQASWKDQDALDTAKTRLEALKVQLAEYQ